MPRFPSFVAALALAFCGGLPIAAQAQYDRPIGQPLGQTPYGPVYGGAPVGGYGYGNGQRVVCESHDGDFAECRTPFGGPPAIARTLSSSACVQGQTWGSRGAGTVWVSSGCRAEFKEGRGGWNPGPGNGNYSVTCNSANGGRNTCAWDSRQGRPMVIQQLSSTPCREGSTWGYSGNQIWVDRGCRARFGTR